MKDKLLDTIAEAAHQLTTWNTLNAETKETISLRFFLFPLIVVGSANNNDNSEIDTHNNNAWM